MGAKSVFASRARWSDSGTCYSGAEFALASFAGANLPQMPEAVNSSRVIVREVDLNRIVSDRFRAFGGNARLIHWKCSGAASCGRLLLALIVAIGAGAVVAKVGKGIAARVSIRPNHIHSRARGNVDLQARWFFALIKRQRHSSFYQSGFRSLVAANKRP
jgi:hypothetical protein